MPLLIMHRADGSAPPPTAGSPAQAKPRPAQPSQARRSAPVVSTRQAISPLFATSSLEIWGRGATAAAGLLKVRAENAGHSRPSSCWLLPLRLARRAAAGSMAQGAGRAVAAPGRRVASGLGWRGGWRAPLPVLLQVLWRLQEGGATAECSAGTTSQLWPTAVAATRHGACGQAKRCRR